MVFIQNVKTPLFWRLIPRTFPFFKIRLTPQAQLGLPQPHPKNLLISSFLLQTDGHKHHGLLFIPRERSLRDQEICGPAYKPLQRKGGHPCPPPLVSEAVRVSLGGTWGAQLVKRLPSAQVMISRSWNGAPCQGPYSSESLLLPVCSLSLSSK